MGRRSEFMSLSYKFALVDIFIVRVEYGFHFKCFFPPFSLPENPSPQIYLCLAHPTLSIRS